MLADAANKRDTTAREALEEIRAAVEVSTAAFAETAPEAALTEAQREVLETAANRSRRGFWTKSWLANGLAAAAVLAIIAAIVIPNVSVFRGKETTIAKDPGIVPEMPARTVSPEEKIPEEMLQQMQALGYGEPDTPTTNTVAESRDKDADMTAQAQPLVPAIEPKPSTSVSEVAPAEGVPGAISGNEPPADANASPTVEELGRPVAKAKVVLAEAVTPEAQPAPSSDLAAGQVATELVPSTSVLRTDIEQMKRLPAGGGRSSGLQNVQVGGALRVRGNWFSGDGVQGAAQPAPAPAAAQPSAGAGLPEISSDTLFSAAGAPASPQVAAASPSVDEREQLKSLGYIDDSQAANARFKSAGIENRNVPFFVDQSQQQVASPGTEAYAPIADAPFVRVADQPLSTFSIDVDTASYSNMRRFVQEGQLPPPDAVRVEELINYFDYAYPAPTDGRPFASHFEAVACPWAPEHTLVRIGLKGREIPRAERPATNLVFLIDVSGSMQPENKLPLVKRAMAMLTRQLDERDRVTIVTYASGVSLALPVTNAAQQDTILNAIGNLGAGGSTNGAGGIQLAYESARRNFLPGGVNRVILATDGDFNVGISDNDSLLALIQQEAKSGVFLSVFGFGMGNLKDDKLELLADKGNGVYGYIDTESEARKVFVEKLSGTLVTIAKDVKIQVEFNPARVGAYRLVGYENRALAAQDFNDDRKDAGEIGAGHTVTALYEVVPVGMAVPAGSVDVLRYQSTGAAEEAPAASALKTSPHNEELLLVKLRYKEPEGATSQLLEFPLKDQKAETMSADLKFASAVAAFGKLLRGNQLGSLNYDGMMQLAQAGLAASGDPHRAEMIHLMLTARPMIEGRTEPEQRRYVQ